MTQRRHRPPAHPYGPPPALQGYVFRPAYTPTSGLAITSLVLSLVGGGLLAVIFGACAMPQIRRGERTGGGLAVAGIVLGVIGTLLWWGYWSTYYELGYLAGGEYPQ